MLLNKVLFMNIRVFAAVALSTLTFSPSASFAQVPPEFQGRGCDLFVNEDGEGQSTHFDVKVLGEGNTLNYAQYAPTMGRLWDNQISAVQCDYKCSIVMYDLSHRQGLEITTVSYQSGFYSLANFTSNNRASSLAVFCS